MSVLPNQPRTSALQDADRALAVRRTADDVEVDGYGGQQGDGDDAEHRGQGGERLLWQADRLDGDGRKVSESAEVVRTDDDRTSHQA